VVLRCTPDGKVTPEMIEYVASQAKTGVAYVTLGNAPVVYDGNSSWHCEMDITTDRSIFGLSKLVNAARENGAEISVQLSHAGRGALPRDGEFAIAPSVVPVPGRDISRIREMDKADLEYIKSRFCDCAARCVHSGMRMIMIQCGHNNLLGQFLSPESNIRKDQYGGSAFSRQRYPLEVLKAVRETVGDNVIIEIRVSATEDTPGGLEFDESLDFMVHAQEFIDIVHISRGNIYGSSGGFAVSTLFKERLHNVEFSRKAKQVLSVPVAVVGNINTIDEANMIISSGSADIVAMAKAYQADNELIRKSINGQLEEIRPCSRCDECGKFHKYGISMRCAVNPRLGMDFKNRCIIIPSEKKKILVAGGGPAGMMAAQTLAMKGHSVILFEKSDHLGGMLADGCRIPFKRYMKEYLDWDIRATRKSGTEIKYKTEVTSSLVADVNPDAVVVATGSRYKRPACSGLDSPNVIFLKDLLYGKRTPGNEIVICGAGMSGLETALMLAESGRSVRVVDQMSTGHFGEAFPDFYKIEILQKLRDLMVVFDGGKTISRFSEHGAVATDSEGRKHIIKADSFIIAAGVEPVAELPEKLLGEYPGYIYPVGSCMGTGRNLYNANQEAFYTAIAL